MDLAFNNRQRLICHKNEPIFGDPFVYLTPKGDFSLHSPGQILACAYTICSNGQTSISRTIPNGSPCTPTHV